MRLWHESLIPYLDRQHLLAQHRECCALRGNGWGRKHATVDYVFRHSPMSLYLYHLVVIHECLTRNYNIDEKWTNCAYRGHNRDPYTVIDIAKQSNQIMYKDTRPQYELCYEEHDGKYPIECLENLDDKNAPIDWIAIKNKFGYERKCK